MLLRISLKYPYRVSHHDQYILYKRVGSRCTVGTVRVDALTRAGTHCIHTVRPPVDRRRGRHAGKQNKITMTHR
jgi:hypothetical protein